MKYDIYAEFTQGLEIGIKDWIESKWRKVRENKSIKWIKKPERLRKELEKDIDIFHKLLITFIQSNENLCPTLYAKLQKLSQDFIEIQKENLLNYIHSILQAEIKGYNPLKSPINKLDLKENPKEAYKKYIFQLELLELLNLLQIIIKSSNLNTKSKKFPILIEIKFTLKKPYISRDDELFYIIDNPLCKEYVFKIPYVRPTTWKGILRYIIRDILRTPPEVVTRLFGNEKDSEITQQGRLVFYPTFLNRIDLDVITPLDRETRTPAKGPILFEVAPEGSSGEFKLLYMPFDIIHDEDRLKTEVSEDLEVLKEAIPKMMLEYGFSAKKTSGYGVVDESINGFIRVGSTEVRFNSWNDFIKSIDKAYKVIIHEQGS